jgi:hypothetical protein
VRVAFAPCRGAIKNLTKGRWSIRMCCFQVLGNLGNLWDLGGVDGAWMIRRIGEVGGYKIIYTHNTP